MRGINVPILLGFLVSGITAATAVIVLTGFLFRTMMPGQLRVTLGVVLFLLAAYRFVMTLTQIKQRRIRNEEE